MAAFLHDDILDNGLVTLTNATKTLHICSAQPATFANVATYTLGNKANPTISAPADATSGRKVTTSAITGGSVTASGTASHYAIVDTVNSKLLAANTLGASQAVTSGNTFSLASFNISIPDPV